MSRNAELTIVTYDNDGVQLEYIYGFTALNNPSIKVAIGNGNIPEKDTELIQGTDYSIARNGNNIGGTITLLDRPSLPDFAKISIIRVVDYEQPTIYPTFYSGSVSEDQADNTVDQTQQLNDRIGSIETLGDLTFQVNSPNERGRIPAIDNDDGLSAFKGSSLKDDGTTVTCETTLQTGKLRLGSTDFTSTGSRSVNYNLDSGVAGDSVVIDTTSGILNLVAGTPPNNVPDARGGNPGDAPIVNALSTNYELKPPREELAETPQIAGVSLETVGDGTATWKVARSDIPLARDGQPGQILQVDIAKSRYVLVDNTGGSGGQVYLVGDGIPTYNLNDSRFIRNGDKWIIKTTGQEVIPVNGSTIDLTQYPELQAALGFGDGLFLQKGGIIPDNSISFDLSADKTLSVVISESVIYVKDGIMNTYFEVFLSRKNFRSVSVKPDGSGILVGGVDGTLYLSTDRGLTWAFLDRVGKETINSIDYGNTSIIFGFDSGKVGTSTDLNNITVVDISNTTPIRCVYLTDNEERSELCGDKGLVGFSDSFPNFLIWTLEKNPSFSIGNIPYNFDQIVNWQESLDLGSQTGLDGESLAGTNKKINYSRQSSTNYYNFWTGTAWNELSNADPENTFVFVTSGDWFRASFSGGAYNLFKGTYNTLASTLVVNTGFSNIVATASEEDVIGIASETEVKTFDSTGLLETLDGETDETFIKSLSIDSTGDILAAIAQKRMESIVNGIPSANVTNFDATASIALREGYLTTQILPTRKSATVFQKSITIGHNGAIMSVNDIPSINYNTRLAHSSWFDFGGADLENYAVIESGGLRFYKAENGFISSTADITIAIGYARNYAQYCDDNTSKFLYGAYLTDDEVASVQTFQIDTSKKVIKKSKVPAGGNIYFLGSGPIRYSDSDPSISKLLIYQASSQDIYAINITGNGTIAGSRYKFLTLPSDVSMFDTKLLRVSQLQYYICYTKSDDDSIYYRIIDKGEIIGSEAILLPASTNRDRFFSIAYHINGLNYYDIISYNRITPISFTRYEPELPIAISYKSIATSTTSAVEKVTYTKDNVYLFAAGRFSKARYVEYNGNENASIFTTFDNDLYTSGDNSFSVYTTSNNRFVIFGGNAGKSSYFEYDGNPIVKSQAFTQITSNITSFGFSAFTESAAYLFGIAGNKIVYQAYNGTSINVMWSDLLTSTTNLEECLVTTDGRFFMAVGASSTTNPVVYWFRLSEMPTPTLQTTVLHYPPSGTPDVTYGIIETNNTIYCTNTENYYYYVNEVGNEPQAANWANLIPIEAPQSSRDLKVTTDGLYLVGTSAVSTSTQLSFKKLEPTVSLDFLTPQNNSDSTEYIYNTVYDAVDLDTSYGILNSIAISPDGKMIALSFANGTVVHGVYSIPQKTSAVISKFSSSVTAKNAVDQLESSYMDPSGMYALYLSRTGLVRKYSGSDFSVIEDAQISAASISKVIKTVVFDNGDGIYFITFDNSLNLVAYISIDTGKNWISTNLADKDTFGYTDAYDASLDSYLLPTKLYIQTDKQVLVGDVKSGIPNKTLRSIKASNGATARVTCGDEGVFVRNTGTEWELKATGTSVSLKTVNLYTSPTEVTLAGENGTFLESTNLGDSFTSSPIGTDTIEHFDSSLDKTFRQYNTKENVYYSENEGAWQPVPAILATECSASFVFEDGGAIISYVGTVEGQVAVAVNFPGQYQVVTTLTKTGVEIVGFAFSNGRVYVYYTDGDIWRSGNNDRFNFSSWNSTGKSVYCVRQTNDYFFAGGATGAVYKSLDLSTTQNTGSTGNIIAIGASDNPVGAPVDDGTAWAADSLGAIYKGTGTGSAWTEITNIPTTDPIISVDVDDTEYEYMGYITDQSEVVITTDNGSTYTSKDDFLEVLYTGEWANQGELFGVAGGSTEAFISYTTDGGTTFVDFDLNQSLGAITTFTSYLTTSVVIGGTEKGEQFQLIAPDLENYQLQNTFNTFPTWLVATSIPTPAYDWYGLPLLSGIIDVDNDYGISDTAYYTGTAGQMYSLIDADRFVKVTNPFIDPLADVTQVSSGGASTYFINSLGETAITIDQGATFTLKTTLEDAPRLLVASDPVILIVLQNNKLFSSNNELGSVTEKNVSSIGTIIDLAVARNGSYHLITNDQGKVFKSIDGFNSFSEVFDANQAVPIKVAIQDDYAYLIGTDLSNESFVLYSKDFGETFITSDFKEKFIDVDTGDGVVIFYTDTLKVYSSDVNLQNLILETEILSNVAINPVQIKSSFNGQYVLAVGNTQSNTTYSIGGVKK